MQFYDREEFRIRFEDIFVSIDPIRFKGKKLIRSSLIPVLWKECSKNGGCPDPARRTPSRAPPHAHPLARIAAPAGGL